MKEDGARQNYMMMKAFVKDNIVVLGFPSIALRNIVGQNLLDAGDSHFYAIAPDTVDTTKIHVAIEEARIPFNMPFTSYPPCPAPNGVVGHNNPAKTSDEDKGRATQALDTIEEIQDES